MKQDKKAINSLKNDNNNEKSLCVMMVVPKYPFPVVGGLEGQAHVLAKALVGQGFRVQSVSGRFAKNQSKLDVVDGVLVHRIPWIKRKWLRFLLTPFSLFRVLYLTRDSYDLIHLHQYSWFGLFTIIIAQLLNKPILTKLPNVGEQGIPGLVKHRLGKLKSAILLKSDAIVAMSQQSISELNDVGFPSSRILATPNGIHVHSTYKNHYSADEKCKVVFVGRLMPQKGLIDLLYVWQDMYKAGISAELEIWGEGPMEQELLQLCSELNIGNSVFFRGRVDSVKTKLEKMDVFVLPSYAEGNSNAILEAMTAALPVVSTRVGGTAMIIGNEGDELLFDAGDQEGLKRCLMILINSSSKRMEVGKKMRNRIECYFDIEQVAQTYAKAYDLLTTSKRDGVSSVSNQIISGK